MRTFLLFAGAALSAAAQPYVPAGGIVNDASHTPPGLPSGPVARGSRFQIYGANIGPAGGVELKTFPVATSLGGVSVTVTVGGAVANCFVVYAQAGTVRAILPSNTPSGAGFLRVSYGGQTSNPAPITVADHNPGLYSVNGFGYGPGLIYNYASPSALFSSLAKPARPGSVASLLATGLGPSTTDNVAPPQQNLPYTIDIRVAGVSVSKVFAGRSTVNPGMDQVIFRLPTSFPTGCFVPVQVVVNGFPSNLVTMAISATGAACVDAVNPVSTTMRTGGSLVVANLTRSGYLTPIGTGTVDRGIAVGRQVPANEFAFDRRISLPPPGSCTAYTATGNQLIAPANPEIGGSNLNLGDITVTDLSAGAKSLTALPNRYESVLGASLGADPPFLNPGTFTLQGTGAGAVGNFTVAATEGDTPAWTNAAALTTVTRSAGASLTFTVTGTRQVYVTGGAYSLSADASTMLLCLAPVGATSFQIPSGILSLLPAQPAGSGPLQGVLGVGAFQGATPATFTATGLTFGELFISNATFQAVKFQ